jgi:disulfide bond formation protein DsbB
MTALLAGGRPFAALALMCLGAVGSALVTQHGFGMLPCPWCILQRMIFVAIALAALPGVLLGAAAVRRSSAALIALLALCGVAAALWQHFVAAASASCNLTLADRIVTGSGLDALLPDVFAPWASCADAEALLFGVPYEFYSLTLFVIAAAVSAWLLRRREA